LLVPEPTRAPGRVERIPPLELQKKIKVQPVFTPDNYADVVLPLIESATKSLCFQNQYVAIGKEIPQAFDDLLKALVKKARSLKKNFRMILREIGDYRLMLEKLEELGFDMQLPQVKVQPATHTKGIIVDGKRVLVGSHNWSGLGVTRNRDASLLIEDAQVARYFETIFDHDWKYMAWAKLRPKREQVHLLSEDATRNAVPAGFSRMPLSAYLDD
jgi:phosphatidylserine/phosphatidylglycerophosphate/cardiolipin synthase-like enzyme